MSNKALSGRMRVEMGERLKGLRDAMASIQREAVPFEPAVFDDEVASKTDWGPAYGAVGISRRTCSGSPRPNGCSSFPAEARSDSRRSFSGAPS